MLGTTEVEMYGTELCIENQSDQLKRFVISRRESDARSVRTVRAGPHDVTWDYSGRRIRFEVSLESGQRETLRVEFHSTESRLPAGENLAYQARTMLRRYLCEIRDNYVATGKARLLALVVGHR